jgi:hypothetical protein
MSRRTSRRPRRSSRLRANIWPLTRRSGGDASTVAQEWRQGIHDTFVVIKRLLRVADESLSSTGRASSALFDSLDYLGYMRCQLVQLRGLADEAAGSDQVELADSLNDALSSGMDSWLDAQKLISHALWTAGFIDRRNSLRLSLTP